MNFTIDLRKSYQPDNLDLTLMNGLYLDKSDCSLLADFNNYSYSAEKWNYWLNYLPDAVTDLQFKPGVKQKIISLSNR